MGLQRKIALVVHCLHFAGRGGCASWRPAVRRIRAHDRRDLELVLSYPSSTASRHEMLSVPTQKPTYLTREGRLMTIITADNRKGGTSDAERAALHKSMLSYSGKYRFEGHFLITTVDVSWNEAWNGAEQKRHYRFEGDKLLIDTVRDAEFGVSRARWGSEGWSGSVTSKGGIAATDLDFWQLGSRCPRIPSFTVEGGTR